MTWCGPQALQCLPESLAHSRTLKQRPAHAVIQKIHSLLHSQRPATKHQQLTPSSRDKIRVTTRLFCFLLLPDRQSWFTS
jgi:hypothetical protein